MEEQTTRKPFYCKRLRLLSYLRQCGLYPVAAIPDKDNPHYTVWKFAGSEKLDAALQEYFADKKGGGNA